ncbi:unnamed protein product [Phytophthora lilii]|uniref:Unnamed protein product n=1 Tax=Phytophthora lilii TaxID=2077276 RepID=A0A9W6X8P8_9STRA|nr:unnamed protein product [Phytophthora lilii]
MKCKSLWLFITMKCKSVIWIDNPAIQSPKLLGATLTARNKFETHAPVDAKYLDGTSLKCDYYVGSGVATTQPRATETPGEYQDLIQWDQLTDHARSTVQNADFADSREVPLKTVFSLSCLTMRGHFRQRHRSK